MFLNAKMFLCGRPVSSWSEALKLFLEDQNVLYNWIEPLGIGRQHGRSHILMRGLKYRSLLSHWDHIPDNSKKQFHFFNSHLLACSYHFTLGFQNCRSPLISKLAMTVIVKTSHRPPPPKTKKIVINKGQCNSLCSLGVLCFHFVMNLCRMVVFVFSRNWLIW